MVSVRQFALLSLLISGLFLSGCTRPEAETSTIKIVVPQAMKNLSKSAYAESISADEKLGHLVVNVSGEGIQFPILHIIEPKREMGEEFITSSSITLDIPMGNNRLIQVLAVYMNQNSGSMSFYYGDTLKTLSQAIESAVVPISSISSTPMVMGNIYGRYLDTALLGPSGVLNVKFHPGAGKHSMIVDRMPMLNGWFSTFMFTGIPMEYSLEDGRVLWGGPVSLDDPRFNPAANFANVMKVTIPAHKRDESGSWQGDEARVNIYGWFANPENAALLTNKSICRDSLSTLTKVAKFDNTSTKLSPQLDASVPSATALTRTDATSLANFYVNGGISSVSGPCVGGNVEYQDFLSFNSSMIDGNGNDGAAPFQMPFKKVTGNVFNVVMNDPREIQAQVLPGLAPLISGFKVFKKVSSVDMHMEHPDCHLVANPISGFVPAGDGSLSGNNLSIISNITAAEASTGVTAVVCPIRPSGELYRMGVAMSKWNFQSYGGGGGGFAGPPHQLKVRTQASVNTGYCTMVTVEVVDSSGNPTNTPNSISFTVAGDAGDNGEFLSSGSICSAGPSSMGLTIPAGQSQVSFQFRGGTSVFIMDHINISGITGSSVPATMVNLSEPIAVLSASSITQIITDFNARSRMNPGHCHPLVFRTVTSYMNPTPVISNTPFDLSVTSSSGTNPFQIYTDVSCTTPLAGGAGNALISSSSSQATYYIKSTATGYGEVHATFNKSYTIDSVSTNIPISTKFHIQSVNPGSETHLILAMPFSGSDANSGNCLPLDIQVKDDSLAAVAATGDLFMYESPGVVSAQYYSDSNCTALISGGSSVPLSAQSSKTIYFRPQIPGSPSVETLQFQARLSSSSGGIYSEVRGQGSTGINPVKIVPQILIGGVPQTPPYSLTNSSGYCAEVRVILKDFAGPLANNLSGSPMNIPMNLTSAMGIDGELHNNPSCTNSVAPPFNFTIATGTAISNSYWIKSTVSASGIGYMFATPGLPIGVQWISGGTMFTLDP